MESPQKQDDESDLSPFSPSVPLMIPFETMNDNNNNNNS